MAWNEEIKKEFAYCGNDVYIGNNTIFTNPSEIILHDRVRIDPFCLITTGLNVGSNVQICSHSVIGGGKTHLVTLGSWCFIGYGSKLFCASEDYSGVYGAVNEFWGSNKIFRGNINFKDYSGVASDVIVMPNVTLPVGCLIGAKSFVYKSDYLDEWSVYLGNPLSLHKKRNKEHCLNLSTNINFLK